MNLLCHNQRLEPLLTLSQFMGSFDNSRAYAYSTNKSFDIRNTGPDSQSIIKVINYEIMKQFIQNKKIHAQTLRSVAKQLNPFTML